MKIIKKLGTGGFGDVYKVKNKGEYYAMKKFKIYNSFISKDFLLELNSYKRFDHPNVLKLINYSIENNEFILLFELGESDLSKFINFNKNYNILNIAYQIISGLLHIHNKSIVTSDLKLQNIIYFKDGRIAISDFGLAVTNTCSYKNEIWADEDIYTINYRPPELLNNEKNINYELCDSWALGLVLYMLANRKINFYWPNENGYIDGWYANDYKKNTILEQYKRIKYTLEYQFNPNKSKIIHFSDDILLNDLIEKLLKFDPRKRITVGEAIYHPYFNDIIINDKYYLKPLENLLTCEDKLINQQFLPHMFMLDVRKNEWRNYFEDVFIKTKYYVELIKNINSLRILTLALLIMDRYYDNLLIPTYKVNEHSLLYIVCYISIILIDRNNHFSDLIEEILEILIEIHDTITIDKIKNIINEITIRLNGRFIYTTVMDFIDLYAKKEDIIELQKRVFPFILSNFFYKYDSQTIALYVLSEYYKNSDYNIIIPKNKIKECQCLNNEIFLLDNNIYENIKLINLID